MSIYYPTCDNTVPDPSCSNCPSKELGDVRSIFFVKNTYAFTDISDVGSWTQGLTDGDIVVFPYTRGTLEMTPTESAGFGDVETSLDGYEYSLQVEEPQYQDNYAFWNAIKNSNEYKAGYRTESQVHLSENEARVIPTAPIGDDKKGLVNWKVNCKWSQEDLVQPYDMPTSVFDQCINV